ncbi:MAG: tetratricopeptide repeat protein [Deltaproteobacteria bacterium]|nr:tetratricopeptide repeat protein [Deltaproteobacteria bacterium]
MVKTKRFQSWELSPGGRMEGVWPVPEGAKPHRYVELDEDQGVVVEIREWVEGSEKPLVRKPVFVKGRVDHSKYEDPLTGLVGTNSYEYDERGYLKARQEVDPQGKLRFRILVTCDEQGRFKEEKIHDRTKRLKERHVYEPNGKGKPLKDTVYKGKDAQELDGVFDFVYDSRGRISRRRWFDAAGALKTTYSYEYDSADRQTMLRVERDGRATVARTTYDSLGRRVRTEYTSGDGKRLGVEDVSESGAVHHETLPQEASPGAPVSGLAGALSDFVSATPEQLAALRMVAYSMLENGRYEEARGIFESVVAVDPEDPYAMAGVGAAEMARRRPDVALEWYERALGHDPSHLPSLLGKAEAELTKGQVDQALGTFKKLFEVSEGSNDPIVSRARGIVQAISLAAKKSS